MSTILPGMGRILTPPRLVALCLLAASLLVQFSCTKQPNLPEILLVYRDQSDTQSLNPSRLQIAAELSLLDSRHSQNGKPHTALRRFAYTGDEDQAMAEVDQLMAANPGIMAVVGDIGSGGTEKLAQLAQKHQVPHLSFFATDDGIFSRNSWSFSYRATVQHETTAMMDILTRRLRIERVAVIGSTFANNYGRWAEIQSRLRISNIQVVAYEAYARDQFDFRVYLNKLAQAQNFDAVLVFLGANQMEHLLQQLRLIPLGKPLIVSPVSLTYEALSDLSGLETSILTTVQTAILQLQEMDSSALMSFAQRYGVAMGIHRLDPLGLWVYDGIDLLCDLISQSKSRQELFDNLVAYRGQRLPGLVSFDNKRSIESSPFTAVKIIDGRFVKVGTP